MPSPVNKTSSARGPTPTVLAATEQSRDQVRNDLREDAPESSEIHDATDGGIKSTQRGSSELEQRKTQPQIDHLLDESLAKGAAMPTPIA